MKLLVANRVPACCDHNFAYRSSVLENYSALFLHISEFKFSKEYYGVLMKDFPGIKTRVIPINVSNPYLERCRGRKHV